MLGNGCHPYLSLCLSVLYQGLIQQLLIHEDPQAAANYCESYIPDCDSALPSTGARDAQQVGGVTNRGQLPDTVSFGE